MNIAADKGTGKLCIGHSNIQGGLTSLGKSVQVKNFIHDNMLDICSINETNLTSCVSTQQLNLPENYEFIRCDRSSDVSRGGCGIIINKFIKHKELGKLESLGVNIVDLDKIEATWLHLKEENIYICSFYRSQLFCPLNIFLAYIVACMLKLGSKKVIWIGDINVDQRKILETDYKELDLILKMFGLVQPVNSVTRRAMLNGKLTESTIDVIFTNCYSSFLSLNVLNHKIGDHQSIVSKLDFNVSKADKFKKLQIRDHCLKNLSSMFNYLAYCIDFDSIINCQDVNEALGILMAHINAAYEHFCPIKTIKTHGH